MKKHLLAVMTILLCTILLTGCGGKEESKIEENKLAEGDVVSNGSF